MTRILATVVTLVVCASPAHAEPPDRVVLEDGSVLQGRLSELKPDDHLTLQLLTGESRTVEWGELARVSGPSFVDLPSLAAFRAPADDPLAGARAATLAQLNLLTAPPRPDPIVSAAAAHRHSGLVLCILGPLLTVAGSAYAAVGASEHDRSMTAFRDTYLAVGTTLLAAGAGTLIGGIVTLAKERRAHRL